MELSKENLILKNNENTKEVYIKNIPQRAYYDILLDILWEIKTTVIKIENDAKIIITEGRHTLKRISRSIDQIHMEITEEPYSKLNFELIRNEIKALISTHEELILLIEDEKNIHFVFSKINKIDRILITLLDTLDYNLRKKSKVYNSNEFYKKELNNMRKKADEAQKEIERLYALQKKKGNIDNKPDENQIQNLKTELNIANEAIEELLIEVEESRKLDDAVTEWKEKIKVVFSQLEIQIKPITDEHKKLSWLFFIYKFFSGLVISLLIAIIAITSYRLFKETSYPNLQEYITLIFPIPILLGLLWGFVTQINRAQNQMVVLSKHIHEVKYTEGLLLAINNLTIDVNDSAKRINEAIDKLLEKHLADNAHNMGWEKHIKEDLVGFTRKDVAKAMKLLKMIRG